MIDIQALLEVAVEATSIGREVFLTQAPGARTAKGDRDYATEVDYAVERKIRAFLAESTPSIGVLGEEEGGSGDRSQMQWALDPVDGTINFAQGIPLCGISLALVADRRPVVGVIDLPFLDTRYTAAAGEGARRDGEPIRASGTSQLRDAMVSVGDYTVGRDAEPKNRVKLALTARLAREALRVRMFGSAALDLAWVADGETPTPSSCSPTSRGTPPPGWSSPRRPASASSTSTAATTPWTPAPRSPPPRGSSTTSSP